jgi:hypothetical protein
MVRNTIVALVLVGLTLAAFAAVYGGNVSAQCPMGKKTAQVVRHVVIFKFKDDASAADIAKVETAFAGLAGKIDVVQGLEWGTNVSPENLSQGFTHCFTLTFNSEADRTTYLDHPEHKAFGQLLHPILDKVLVIDYLTKP